MFTNNHFIDISLKYVIHRRIIFIPFESIEWSIFKNIRILIYSWNTFTESNKKLYKNFFVIS